MRLIIKQIKRFLESGASAISEVKKIQKDYSKNAGKVITFEFADTLFKARKMSLNWIYQYMGQSEFWAFTNYAKESKWSQDMFINQIQNYIDVVVDNDILLRLKDLYNYIMNE